MHNASRRTPSLRRRGFTLIEILIVVVILGILASVVIASLSVSAEEARRSAFSSSGRVLVDACMRYRFYTGAYPADGSSGVIPAGLEDYFIDDQYSTTPIGGVWDTENNAFGITAAVGVHFDGTGETRDDAFMLGIDSKIDDGDLSTGGFRKLAADRYYFIVAD